MPEIPVGDNDLLEDWGLPEPEPLDKDMDDFITSILNPFQDGAGTVQVYLPADSGNTVPEDQLQFPSSGIDFPGSDFAIDAQGSEIVQADHNYSLHWDWSMLQSMAADLAGVDMAEDDTSIGVAPVDAIPQVEPAAIMQANIPELVLTEEQKQLLMGESFSYLPLTQAKDQLLTKVRRKVRNRQSPQNIYRRKKSNMDHLENKVAACMAQNQRLEKKVQVLQKQNRSLFVQLRKLQAFVDQPTFRTAVAKTYMTVILSFSVFFSPNACLVERIRSGLDLEAIHHLMLWQQLASSWFPLSLRSSTPRAALCRQRSLSCGRGRGRSGPIVLPQRGHPATPCRCDFCRYLLHLGVTLGILPGRSEQSRLSSIEALADNPSK